MNRILFIFLSLLFAVFAKAEDSGKNLVLTKGQTVTLDVASDLGGLYIKNGKKVVVK